MKTTLRIFLFLIISSYLAVSCNTIDLYEKSVSLPEQEWPSSYKPAFTFTIKDTIAPYSIYLVLRHTEKYNYTNIWLNVSVKLPGTTETISFKVNEKLADNDKWLGSGMDDLYEHRLDITEDLVNNNISFRKKGDYQFTLEQIMREDPLKYVLNAGLRVEKKNN